MDHSGAASTYRALLTHTHTPCSSSSSLLQQQQQQQQPQPPGVVVVEQRLDAGELYPEYVKVTPEEVRRRSDTLRALGVFGR